MSRALAFLFAIFIALTSAAPSCTPGTLNPDAIDQLPSSSDFTLSFVGFDLNIRAIVTQTSPARGSFTFTFHNGAGDDCLVSAGATIGTETTSGTCTVPITDVLTWPPSGNCFVNSSVPGSGIDKYTSTLILSWTETVTANSVDYPRTVSVEVPVEVDIPTTIDVTSNFVTSASSTDNFVTTFYISTATFGPPTAGKVTYDFVAPTLTAQDGSKVLIVDTLSPLTAGTITQPGAGSADGALWEQTWDWDLPNQDCAGISGTTFTFRATFACQTEGASSCASADYFGRFQDLVLTVTTASVCPVVPPGSLSAVATLQLMNAADRVQTVFSSLDVIHAKISAITNEDILTSATVMTVEVNGNPWTDGVEFTLVKTDVIHNVLNFAPTAGLISSSKLKDSPSDQNSIDITLALEWKAGGLSKRSNVRAATTYAPSTTTNQTFTVFSVPEESASSFTAPAYAVVALMLLFAAFL